jgi:hypothetical protein
MQFKYIKNILKSQLKMAFLLPETTNQKCALKCLYYRKEKKYSNSIKTFEIEDFRSLDETI